MVRNQTIYSGGKIEHIVVADGPDSQVRLICHEFGARYEPLANHQGHFGGPCRDQGILCSNSPAVAFWDDDNTYHPWAAEVLMEALADGDLGIVQTRHRHRSGGTFETIPQSWNGAPAYAQIDTMCLIVRTEIARLSPWSASHRYGHDVDWATEICKLSKKTTFLSKVIGYHG